MSAHEIYSRLVDYMFLTCSNFGVYSQPSHLNRRERYLGRFGTWRWERRLRAGADVASRTREALGFRPGPLRGPATVRGWTRDRQRREIAVSQVPGRTDRGLEERRDGTSRGVAVCLCFPAIRETSRGCYQGAPFGVPPPSFLLEGGSLNPPFTRSDLRAAMTLARATTPPARSCRAIFRSRSARARA
ncbi:MAG: hypothetical protein QOD89_1503 [Bradyrhizobium sp.]|jgi:hypothetical protein|nr:hypothetical protein [Bradyrhizobium sp.]